MSRPIQKALKLPATKPDRIVSDAPPSRDAVTTSCTCLEWELVNALVNSGMSTAASVPQLMIVASCHHRFGSVVQNSLASGRCTTILTSLRSSQLIPNDVVMQRMDAIQIRRVNGCSKSKCFRPAYFFSEIAWLMK